MPAHSSAALPAVPPAVRAASSSHPGPSPPRAAPPTCQPPPAQAELPPPPSLLPPLPLLLLPPPPNTAAAAAAAAAAKRPSRFQKILWGKHEVSTAKYSVCLGQGHQLSWSLCGHMRGQTASRQQRLTSERLTFDAQTLDLDASHQSSSLTPRHTRQNILQPRRQRLLQALASCSTRILDMNA